MTRQGSDSIEMMVAEAHVNSFVRAGIIDADKVRDEAVRRATGDQYDPNIYKTVIHYHAYGDPCAGQDHEYYGFV